jgi:AraC-like DNA-binding protein
MNARLAKIKDWTELARLANWSLAQMAKHCCVSESTLLRHFHQYLGKTFRDWLVEQQLKLALELRRDGSSIKEIAVKLGYRHPQTFAREFKKHWGKCPVELLDQPLKTFSKTRMTEKATQ